jgi:hypothetical protein
MVKRLLLAGTVLAALSTAAAAETTLHVLATATSAGGGEPNIVGGNNFYIGQTSNGDTLVNPPGLLVFFAVPNDDGVPSLSSVSLVGGGTFPGANVVGVDDIATWTTTTSTENILKNFLQTATITADIEAKFPNFTAEGTTFDGASLDKSLQWGKLAAADENSTFLKNPFTSVTSYEVYAAEIEEPFVGNQVWDFKGAFPNGTFVVPVGFTSDKVFTTSLTNVGLVNATATIPETSTWSMLALGFVGLGFVGFRQPRRVPRSLV